MLKRHNRMLVDSLSGFAIDSALEENAHVFFLRYEKSTVIRKVVRLDFSRFNAYLFDRVTQGVE